MVLQPLDLVLLGGVVLLAGIGLFRGLSGELGSVAGFAAASLAGFCLMDAARACAVAFGLGGCMVPAAYAIDFVFALVAFGIARLLVSRFVSLLVPQPTDAFLGLLGGLFKGGVALGLLTGVGLMPAGTYSTGFFATHSTVVREIAAWADANLAESPAGPEAP